MLRISHHYVAVTGDSLLIYWWFTNNLPQRKDAKIIVSTHIQAKRKPLLWHLKERLRAMRDKIITWKLMGKYLQFHLLLHVMFKLHMCFFSPRCATQKNPYLPPSSVYHLNSFILKPRINSKLHSCSIFGLINIPQHFTKEQQILWSHRTVFLDWQHGQSLSNHWTTVIVIFHNFTWLHVIKLRPFIVFW